MNNIDDSSLDIYSRDPIYMHDGIPIFSKNDTYVLNYQKIASDHISQISDTQENPFMEEELWRSLEVSTRAYIQKHVAKGSKILDVGVGLGRLLEPLTEYERYGVDISLDYLALARRRGIEVALAKIEELPYKADFFDAIVVCDVLEHVFDINYCCEKILQCLRPGGVLIIRVPFREDLNVYLNEDLPYEFIHLRNFDEASLRLHFQKIFGLQFLEAEPTTPYLQGSPRLKLRLLPDETRKKLSKIALTRPEFSAITDAVQVSEEVFQAWIYDLKKNEVTLFNEISDDLILGIEINAAFIKPYSDSAPLRALRGNTIEFQPLHERPELPAFNELAKDFLKFRQEFNLESLKTHNQFLSIEQIFNTKSEQADFRFSSLEQLIGKKSEQSDIAHEAIKQQLGELKLKMDNEIEKQNQITELIKNHISQQNELISEMHQTLSVLAVPFYVKFARKIRKLCNF